MRAYIAYDEGGIEELGEANKIRFSPSLTKQMPRSLEPSNLA